MSKKATNGTLVPAYTRVRHSDNFDMRARVSDPDGKRVGIYAKDEEEPTEKVLQAQKKSKSCASVR